MKDNKKQKAFTLIELLVVIAIIGILSAIVLAALGSARAKSKDKAIISELASIRPQAEIYYTYSASTGGPGNYGVKGASSPNANTDAYCDDGNNVSSLSTMFGSAGKGSVVKLLESIKEKLPGNNNNQELACSAAPNVPNAPITSWAVAARLTEGGITSDYWCVDSKGTSKLIPYSAGSITTAALAINISVPSTVTCK